MQTDPFHERTGIARVLGNQAQAGVNSGRCDWPQRSCSLDSARGRQDRPFNPGQRQLRHWRQPSARRDLTERCGPLRRLGRARFEAPALPRRGAETDRCHCGARASADGRCPALRHAPRAVPVRGRVACRTVKSLFGGRNAFHLRVVGDAAPGAGYQQVFGKRALQTSDGDRQGVGSNFSISTAMSAARALAPLWVGAWNSPPPIARPSPRQKSTAIMGLKPAFERR